MKTRRLGMQGFAHHFLLALIVVSVAIGGTYWLVFSKADTCDMSAPVTGPAVKSHIRTNTGTTEPVTDPPYCPPVTDPSPPTIAASCTILGVPSSVTAGTVIKSKMLVTNTGNMPVVGPLGTMNASYGTVSSSNPNFWSQQYGTIAPGSSATLDVTSFTVNKGGTNDISLIFGGKIFYGDQNGQYVSRSCSATTTIKGTPAPVLAANCNLLDVPAVVRKGDYVKPRVSFTNTGNVTISTLKAARTVVDPNVGANAYFDAFNLTNIAPGKSGNKVFGRYDVAKNTKASSATITVSAVINNTKNVSCSKTFAIR